MHLIKTLEIGYFRSIYKVEFKNLEDLNILFGKNDSGKSNVIRALNLFFKSETNIGRPFNLETDLCHARLAESKALSDARKFVYIKITFLVPKTWEKSLGKTFYVKKSWSATTGEVYNFESSIKDKTKSSYLTRFLLSIKFRYIPAIKDRSIFSNLLSEMYGTLSKDSDFASSLDGFSSELQNKTKDLQENIFKSINYDSRIAPPTDLTLLFKALDFDTTNSTGEKYSLTNQHGDGIQVRHIPSILQYLSKHGKEQYTIWGFEEPENSLELTAAMSEAARFLDISKDSNIQIFVTSHSPAFYSLEDINVRKYYVGKEEYKETNRLVSTFEPINSKAEMSKLLGDKTLILSITKAMDEYINLEKNISELTRKIETNALPKLFVEGNSDKIIVNAVAKKLFGTEIPFDVIDGMGTTKMYALKQDGKIFSHIFSKKLFVLVDNDTEGREYYKNGRLMDGGKWTQHNSNKNYFCRLPFSQEFESAYKIVGVDKASWPGTIENCIPLEIRKKAIAEGKYKVKDELYSDFSNNGQIVEKIYQKIMDKSAEEFLLYYKPIHFEYKERFAEYLATMISSNKFIFSDMENILSEMVKLLNTPES